MFDLTDALFLVDDGYDPKRILLQPTRTLEIIGDNIQVAKGEQPLFNHENNPDWEDENTEDWYDFYVDTDGNTVTDFYFCYGIGCGYCDRIEITEETKKKIMEAIYEYYGGRDEYLYAIKDYEEDNAYESI